LIGKVITLIISVLIAALVSGNLGNPGAGLGSSEELEVPEALASRSLTYGLDPWDVASVALRNTVTVVVIAVGASVLLGSLCYLRFGKRASFEALAYVPEYVYALLLYLLSWRFPWPSPLPGADPSKAAEYALVIIMSECPKVAYVVSEGVEGREELKGVRLFWKAVGLDERGVRSKLLLASKWLLLAQFFNLTSLVLERSVLVEPLVGYWGVGEALCKAVTEADPQLAFSSFLAVAVSVIALNALGEALVRRRLALGAA